MQKLRGILNVAIMLVLLAFIANSLFRIALFFLQPDAAA